MSVNKRLKLLRKELKMNQNDLGFKINISRSHISSLENGTRELTERIIHDLTRELNVNEEWLRTGKGEMFVQSDTFSLDEYARKNNLSQLEIDIIRSYMEVDENVRKGILDHFKGIFAKESATQVDPIEKELNDYKKELVAEKKGLLASGELDEKGKIG